MTDASFEQHMTDARDEHLVPGREIHLRDMRGHRFWEVDLITGASQDDAIANIWNTTGVCDPTPEQLGALDADVIARENGALDAWLNPVRHWAFDQIDVREAGDDRTFGGITGTWMGAADAATMLHATVQDSYSPGYVYGGNAFTYLEGSDVYLLDAPDGEVFILKSIVPQPDVSIGADGLAHLASRLELPDGWGFRMLHLDQDLEVSAAGHDNLAHVMQDNLHNVYQGSDVGRAFSLLCMQEAER